MRRGGYNQILLSYGLVSLVLLAVLIIFVLLLIRNGSVIGVWGITSSKDVPYLVSTYDEWNIEKRVMSFLPSHSIIPGEAYLVNRMKNSYVISSKISDTFQHHEYQCTGSCYCDGEIYRRTTSIVQKSFAVSIMAVSATLAVKIAQDFFNLACDDNFRDYCSGNEGTAVKSDIEFCEKKKEIKNDGSKVDELVESLDSQDKKKKDREHDADTWELCDQNVMSDTEQLIYYCKGKCVNRDFSSTSKTMDWKVKHSIEIENCATYSQEGYVYIKTPEWDEFVSWDKSDYWTNFEGFAALGILVKKKFYMEYSMSRYCREVQTFERVRKTKPPTRIFKPCQGTNMKKKFMGALTYSNIWCKSVGVVTIDGEEINQREFEEQKKKELEDEMWIFE